MFVLQLGAGISSGPDTTRIQIVSPDVEIPLSMNPNIASAPLSMMRVVPTSSSDISPISEPESKTDEVSESPGTERIEYTVPNDQNGFKSWMPGSAITNKESKAYQVLSMSASDDNGQYKLNDDYLAALGSYYSDTVGDRFEVTLSSGKVFTIVLGDLKANIHTDAMHQRTSANGCMIEFIVDMSKFKNTPSYLSGDISSLGFEGTIVKMVKIGNVFTDSVPEPEPEPEPDRSKPIYEVYKDGYFVEVSAELQWLIRDLTAEHDYPERIVYGMILAESTFNATSGGHGCWGLAQISTYWLKAPAIEPYRLTDDYKSRDLKNPEHNLLTLFEIWNYARDVYDLDPWDELSMKRLLYWHNTGKDPRRVNNWPYSNKIFRYADELVEIIY